nr:hypothetical protein [Angustibacter aerolatus]
MFGRDRRDDGPHRGADPHQDQDAARRARDGLRAARQVGARGRPAGPQGAAGRDRGGRDRGRRACSPTRCCTRARCPTAPCACTGRSRARSSSLDVTDGGGGSQPKPVHQSLLASSGRGLRIVRSLAHEWGVQDEEHGRTVWVCLGGPSRRRRP